MPGKPWHTWHQPFPMTHIRPHKAARQTMNHLHTYNETAGGPLYRRIDYDEWRYHDWHATEPGRIRFGRDEGPIWVQRVVAPRICTAPVGPGVAARFLDAMVGHIGLPAHEIGWAGLVFSTEEAPRDRLLAEGDRTSRDPDAQAVLSLMLSPDTLTHIMGVETTLRPAGVSKGIHLIFLEDDWVLLAHWRGLQNLKNRDRRETAYFRCDDLAGVRACLDARREGRAPDASNI